VAQKASVIAAFREKGLADLGTGTAAVHLSAVFRCASGYGAPADGIQRAYL